MTLGSKVFERGHKTLFSKPPIERSLNAGVDVHAISHRIRSLPRGIDDYYGIDIFVTDFLSPGFSPISEPARPMGITVARSKMRNARIGGKKVGRNVCFSFSNFFLEPENLKLVSSFLAAHTTQALTRIAFACHCAFATRKS